ncbi:glycosyltransferase family 4 protein [soil metagenome]
MPSLRILFIVPYPHGEAPSQRFRFEQYYPALQQAGITYEIAPFLDTETWQILYKPGHKLAKVWGIVKGFGRRKLLMFQVRKYDYIFLHREAAPIGPPIFEWFMAKVLRAKIIYDFDDAIWLPNTSEHNKIAAGLKWHQKVNSICKWAYKVSCGNEYLCDFARKYNANVVLNPTTIDTVNLHKQTKNQHTDKVVIGWTGTHSTVGYLDGLVPVLRKLEQELDFEFRVISNRPPDFQLKSLVYVPWKKDTEIADLLQFNFGVMPLTDDKWAKGKCGFKALQYMSLGMPAVVSPVGVNTCIVTPGEDGYLCETPLQWEDALRTLIEDEQLRVQMGLAARQKIVSHFSVLSNTGTFLCLFAP